MQREKYHLNASFQAIGAFWPHGQSKEKFTGTLSSEKGKVALTSAPIYSTEDVHSEVARMFGAAGCHQRVERTKSLCGFTSEGECSLLSAAQINAGGLIDLSSGQGIADNQYRVWAAVMGLHVESADAAASESAALTFSGVSEWFPSAFDVTCGAEQNSITTRTTPLEVFRFHCEAMNSEVICRVHTQAPMKRRRAKVKSTLIITIQPTMAGGPVISFHTGFFLNGLCPIQNAFLAF